MKITQFYYICTHKTLTMGLTRYLQKILQNFYKFYTFYKIMRTKISTQSALDIVSMMLFLE